MSEDNSQGTGRTLGGGNNDEPLPPTWSRQNSGARIGRIGDLGSSNNNIRSSGGTRIAGLRDLPSSSSRQPPPSSHSDNEDDDDDDYDYEAPGADERESWFTGGERSGLSVQNPDRPGQGVPSIVRDLLRKAAEAGPPSSEDRPVPQRAFSGTGYTLGSDEVDSTIIPDTEGSSRNRGERVFRQLTLWRNGFSIEDGPLIRYDDPEHEDTLKLIFAGQAPLHLLNIELGQSVELRLAHRTNEDYVPPPPKPFSAFEGSGNRLGAPVPSVAGAGSSFGSSMPGAFPSSSSSSNTQATASDSGSSSSIPKFEVDQTKPTTSVQIRLADGTRMVCRMNLTHTVGDIRNFINAARPENLTRAYTIGTTFPNRTLTDNQATIEGAGLVNSVVVQRWA